MPLTDKPELEHTSLRYLSKTRLDEIAGYVTKDVAVETFTNPETWRDLRDILLFHPSPVTRHEACFIAAELQVPVAGRLVSAVKFDESIVNKHEAAESLGKLKDTEDAWMAYVFLRNAGNATKRKYGEGVYHPDVQATIRESIDELENRFPYFRESNLESKFSKR